MKKINFAVTVEELQLLASLASDQLFRRQFIDPKMPGYKSKPEEVDQGKAIVSRMRAILDDLRRANSAPLVDAAPLKERRIV